MVSIIRPLVSPLARIDQHHPPRFGVPLVYFHAVVGHVEGDVRHVQEVVGEVFLDDIAFVAEADDEVVDPMCGIKLHHVPKNRPSADLDHRLGPQMAFLTDPGAVATGEDHALHLSSPNAAAGGVCQGHCNQISR